MGFWMVSILGQNRLSVVMNQCKIEILEGTELKKELVLFLDTKLLPLIGFNLVHKTTAGVKRDLVQKEAKGVEIL